MRTSTRQSGSWVDPVPAVWRWTVDTDAPATTMTRTTSGTSATFTFDADEQSYYQCKLDTPAGEGSWLWCQSPRTFTGLQQGAHTFSVKAMDAAGNVETAPPSHRWTVDTVAPATMLVASTREDRASFAFSAPGATSYACRLTTPTGSGPWQACTSPAAHTGLAAGAHRFEVRATDAAGNVEAVPASHSWTATQPAPALVVGKGRGHGTVKVYAGSRLLRTVRLAAPRTADRVLVPVGSLTTPYTGRLRVVVATQGRPVRIEGLGVATG